MIIRINDKEHNDETNTRFECERPMNIEDLRMCHYCGYTLLTMTEFLNHVRNIHNEWNKNEEQDNAEKGNSETNITRENETVRQVNERRPSEVEESNHESNLSANIFLEKLEKEMKQRIGAEKELEIITAKFTQLSAQHNRIKQQFETLKFRFKKLNNLKERQNAEDVSKCNDLQEKEATRTTKLKKILKEKDKGPLTKHVENLLKSLKNKNDHNISSERRQSRQHESGNKSRGTVNYNCDLCDKCFSDVDALKVHMMKIHMKSSTVDLSKNQKERFLMTK